MRELENSRKEDNDDWSAVFCPNCKVTMLKWEMCENIDDCEFYAEMKLDDKGI